MTIQKIKKRAKKLLNENLEYFEKWIIPYSNNLSFTRPQAGGFIYVKYNLDINSTDLIHNLRKNEGVFLVPGDSFGMDGYFRVGLGSEPETFIKGLDLISTGLNRIFPDLTQKNFFIYFTRIFS